MRKVPYVFDGALEITKSWFSNNVGVGEVYDLIQKVIDDNKDYVEKGHKESLSNIEEDFNKMGVGFLFEYVKYSLEVRYYVQQNNFYVCYYVMDGFVPKCMYTIGISLYRMCEDEIYTKVTKSVVENLF
ncbi:MAG: hypothetical protein ACRDBY_14145 [Cetobacterium sp.]